MNQMIAGQVGDRKLNYTGYHTGYADSKIKDWLTNYQAANTAATFTPAINHPDHGVEANFRFKIPPKIRVDDILNTGLFDLGQLVALGYADGYIHGGPQGVIFRWPYEVWTSIPELNTLASGNSPNDNSIMEAIPAFNVNITHLEAGYGYGGEANFPYSNANYYCLINGAGLKTEYIDVRKCCYMSLGILFF